jgi:hypothetical protein
MSLRLGRLTVLGLLVLSLLLTGCNPLAMGRSTLSSTVGSRVVKATVDGSASIVGTSSGGTSTVTITFSGGKLVITNTSAELDGKEIAKVPEAAKLIEVDYTAKKLTVSADGVRLYPAGEDAGK